MLRADEVLLEFALAEPNSYAVVATRSAARVHRLAGRTAIHEALEPLVKGIRGGADVRAEARTVGQILLDRIPEIAARKRVVVSADGDLHQLPFEVLVTESGKPLLDSHVISYVPSGSVLVGSAEPSDAECAVEVGARGQRLSNNADRNPASAGAASPFGAISRGVYDVEATQLPALPSANDEARSVGAAFGPTSTVLLGDSATELELKKQPLQDYKVIHFAVHGIVSTKFPARSALVLRPGGTEDGLFQAREILALRLAADLVTLSACDTGSGTVHGQEGVASLVRPFLAAGARTRSRQPLDR